MAGVLSRRPSTLALAAAGMARVWRDGRGAVVAVWAIVTVISTVAVVPALAWWSRELGSSVEGARLLGAASLAPIMELTRDNPAGPRMTIAAAAAAAVVALALNPFLAGGLLGRLSDGRVAPGRAGRDPAEDGPAARFAADGVRHYVPLLLAMLLVGAGAFCLSLVLVPAATSVVAAVRGPEATVLAAMLAALVLVAGVATIVLDVARIHIVRGETRNAARAVALAVAFVVTRPLRLTGLAVIAGAATASAGVLLITTQGWLAGGTWPAILGTLALRQIHALARTGIRATWLASELTLVEAAETAPGLPQPRGGSEILRENGDPDPRPGEFPNDFAPAPGPGQPRGGGLSPAGEERPEVLVVVEREAGEGGLAGDERLGGGDFAPEVAGGLTAEGDAGRGDAGAGEAGVDGAVPPRDRGGA